MSVLFLYEEWSCCSQSFNPKIPELLEPELQPGSSFLPELLVLHRSKHLPAARQDASERRVVNVSTVFGAAMTLGSFVVAPLFQKIDVLLANGSGLQYHTTHTQR